jgi:predicted porin
MRKSILFNLLLFCGSFLFAQEKKILDSINFYGALPIQLAIFDKKFELQENAPLIGTELFRNLPQGWSVDAKLEFGLHLINGTNFNPSANTSADFIANPFLKREVFASRLAYFGIAHEKYGSLRFGKQWGVYYDIGAYTDNFSLFGGSANGIYAGGTDGGWKGTGRADNAVVYRNNFGPFELGLQSQLFNGERSYGISLQYHSKFGLSLGTSYNDAAVIPPVNKFVVDIGNRTSNFIVGAKYEKEKYYGAFTFSANDDAIVVVDTGKIVSFPTYGYELSLGYHLNDKWTFEGGFNYIQERESRNVFSGDYYLFHLILGANYHITPDTKLYLMTRFSSSNNTEYVDNVNAYVFGFKYNFNFGWKRQENN